MVKRLFALLLFALPLAAQTPVVIQNANFQAPVTFTASDAAGDQWVPNTVPGWTIGAGPGVPGTFAGIQSLVSACGAPIQMMYSNDPTVTQDVGAQQAGTYQLTVGICRRLDGVNDPASYTIGLNGCSQTASNTTLTLGQIQAVTLSCTITTPSGDNVISLGCSGAQCDYASVALTFTPAGPPLPPLTLNIATKIVTCVKCDRTDDTPAQGSLVFQQGSLSNAFTFAADGSIAINASINMQFDPVTFSVLLVNSTGQQVNGSGWQWSVPRANLSAGIATLGTLSFGGLAFKINSDGSVSFAGFLPVSQ